MWPFSPSYLTVVNQKRNERERALAAITTSVALDHLSITQATATEIVSRIKEGQWTASQVLEAFIARAKLAQNTTNCLTEILFEQAIQRAKDLDNEFALTGKLKGPLHGVPMSIKEQFDIAGVDTSVGFTRWANNPAKTNADIVDILLDAGAVIFVKTNIPQTMFAFECSNPLWGRTTNPFNNQYTSGGSSGGEGALIAMDGSPLGVGTDIGGSLRIPAAYCGIYSLKPANGRVTCGGTRGPNPGFEGIKTVAGPMGRSIDDLELFSRVVFGQQGSYHDIPPVPFRDVTLPPKLKFGYYTSDYFIKASPACKRAVLETVAALRKQGHEFELLEIPSALKSLTVFTGLSGADGYRTMLSHIGPDPTESAIRLVTITPNLPGFLRAALAWILETVIGDKIFANVLRNMRPRPVHEYTQFVNQRNELTRSFYQEVWDRYSLDGIIAPVQALPQLPNGGCNNFLTLAASTTYYNVIDHPVGIIPVTRVDASKDKVGEEWWHEPDHGSKVVESGLFKGKKALYQPQATNGMPIAVQVVGKKWEEEKVLAMMKVVDGALGARGFGPGTWDRFSNGTNQ